MQNGDRMYDPYMDFLIDTEAGTLRAFSYENSGIGVYQEADPADPAQEKKIAGFGQFFATWLNNIASQGYELVRATMLVNGCGAAASPRSSSGRRSRRTGAAFPPGLAV